MANKKILLVDDDVDDQVLFLDALNEIATDIECITAGNGVEAISTLKLLKTLPAIIFLDLNMPLMNGFECLEYLKNQELYKDIPVVIFTTSSNPADKAQAKKLGAELFLQKHQTLNYLKPNCWIF